MGGPRASRPYMPGYGVYATQGKGLIPWQWAEGRLTQAHNYFLATVRPDGRPHVMPVWGVWLGGRFWFSCAASAQKARNLSSNPHCVVAVEPAHETVILEGVAEEVSDRTVLQRFAEVYDRKYDWKINIDVGGIYAVRPRVAFGILEDTSDDTDCLTRWEFEHE